MFSIDEISELAINQLSETELDHALEAFNGFTALFNKDWVAGYFQGARSPAFVRAILAMWDDWVPIRNLPRAEQLVERWRVGINEGGVQPEVRVFARLVRTGGALELFPEASGRVPDCRFRPRPDDEWVYLEVSQRGLSQVRQHAQGVLRRISEAGANAVAGMHGKVAILRMPTHNEVDRIVAWLKSGPRSGERLEDLAEFYLAELRSPIGPDDVINQRTGRPRLLAAHIASGNAKRGTASLGISDAGAQELLEAKAAQLPFNQPGVVVLDVSSVIGGHEEWVPLIQRRLQPRINTRISAVVLLNTTLAAQGGFITEGQILINPHSKSPITNEAGELLEQIVES